jgi:hypothetical protein
LAIRPDNWRARGVEIRLFSAGRRSRYRSLLMSSRRVVEVAFPGAELVEKGLADLADGVETVDSLLVSIGAPRLRALGYELRSPFEDAEDRLYLLVARDDPAGAHSTYNALVRRLVSFERAAEGRRSQCGPAGSRARKRSERR